MRDVLEAMRVSRQAPSRLNSRGHTILHAYTHTHAHTRVHIYVYVIKAMARIAGQECSQTWKFDTFLHRDTAAYRGRRQTEYILAEAPARECHYFLLGIFTPRHKRRGKTSRVLDKTPIMSLKIF